MRDKLEKALTEKLKTVPLCISSSRRGNDNGLRNVDEVVAVVIDALLGELEEVEFKPDETPVCRDLRLLHGSMLYQQLLDLRKNDR